MKFLNCIKSVVKPCYLRVGMCFIRPLSMNNKQWTVLMKPVMLSGTSSEYRSLGISYCKWFSSSIMDDPFKSPVDKSVIIEEKVQDRTNMVIQEMLETSVIDQKKSESLLFRDFVETLVKGHTQKNVIKKHFLYYPDFYKNVTQAEVQKVNSILKEFSFDSRDIMVRLPRVISVFKINEQDLRMTLDQLKNLGFSTKQIVTLCGANPKILVVPLDLILSSFHELHQWFSKRDVLTIIMGNPRVLLKGEHHILSIINYIQHEMGLDVQDAIRSQVFRRSLLRLKTRHQFLVRSGQWSSNTVTQEMLPSFKSVVDVKDKYFCRKVAGLSIEEYETFEKLMELEEEDFGESESDSDTDEVD